MPNARNDEKQLEQLNQQETEAIATKLAYFFFDYFKKREGYQVTLSESGFSVEDSPDSEAIA